MTKYFCYAYKNYSSSAKKLMELLEGKLIKHSKSKFKPSQKKLVINWGSTKLPDYLVDNQQNMLNKYGVEKAVNKLKTMKTLDGKSYCLQWTTDKSVAKNWITEGDKVVCRTLLTGNSGNGIIIASNENEVIDAPLYTKYVPKKEEYRVHVFMGKVLQIQRKAKRKDVKREDANYQIRNHRNGFIFQIHGFETPQHVIDNAVEAVHILGLDFGAVDVAYNQKQDKSYILEVNTAPGIEGTTLELYAKAIKEVM